MCKFKAYVLRCNSRKQKRNCFRGAEGPAEVPNGEGEHKKEQQ